MANNYLKPKDVISIIEKKPLPILIIFSVLILPFIINQWSSLFPEHIFLTIVILSIWSVAIYLQFKEIESWKRKTRLVSYLERHGPWRSIKHLTTEWDAKDDYSEKIIKNLIKKYPDELNDTPMKDRGAGVGLNKKKDNDII